MGMVPDCHDFDRLWNDRLDERRGDPEPSERTASLADHAATCEGCRSRDLAFRELEAVLNSGALAPVASAEAIVRWAAAAAAARPVVARSPVLPRSARRRFVAVGLKLGVGVPVAALVLIGSKLLLPVLYPIEAPPQPRTAQSPSLQFEKAVAEATTMTWELAREVSAPAARISSEALGLSDKPSLPPFAPTQYELPEPPLPSVIQVRDDNDATGVESISGSARQAFRFLIGTTTDEQLDPETAGGS